MTPSSRRSILAATVGAAATLATAALPRRAGAWWDDITPIVFVHGNGDTAALWNTIVWRFETNGWPRSHLWAIDLRYPTARTVDATPEDGRSSTAEVRDQLGLFVAKVRAVTGAAKVALVGNSRGANTIRNYVKNGGGAAYTSHVVLGGGVNHGVIVSDKYLVGSEFNGAGPFMRQLNAGPNEVVAGVPFLTLRSDRFDKYAQPDGRLLGLPGVPTGISYDAPALAGAINLVLPQRDHRESSYSPEAFRPSFEFIAGQRPRFFDIRSEWRPILGGKVSGVTAGVYDNIGVSGAKLDIYRVRATTGERLGDAILSQRTGPDGRWGPLAVSPEAFYEFVVQVPGFPITHIYRSPFLRGSDIVHLRPELPIAEAEAGSIVTMSRPRGYLGVDRDRFTLDGGIPTDVGAGVPTDSTATVRLPFTPQRSVVARFNRERITVRNWPLGHIAIAEFQY